MLIRGACVGGDRPRGNPSAQVTTMVDQIETAATAQRAVTTPISERSDAIATLRQAERYDHVRIAPLDVTCRVLNQIGDFGVDGVRAAGEDTTYLLVAESDPELPDVRIERWNGSTFRPVLRTSRVCIDGDGDERVFRVPAGVRVDRDRRTGGGRGGLRTYGRRAVGRDDGAGSHGRRSRPCRRRNTTRCSRPLSASTTARPFASELFEGARRLFRRRRRAHPGAHLPDCDQRRRDPSCDARRRPRRHLAATRCLHAARTRGTRGAMTAGMVSLGYAVFSRRRSCRSSARSL